MKTQPIIEWLIFRLSEHSDYISKVAIFGSIARNASKPNDCDLLIVSPKNVDSEAWQSLQKRIKEIGTDFLSEFSLPLNAALLTEGEWIENQSIYKDLIQVKLKAG